MEEEKRGKIQDTKYKYKTFECSFILRLSAKFTKLQVTMVGFKMVN